MLLGGHLFLLHNTLNGYALLTRMGVQIMFLWRLKCSKSADFDVSGPDIR